MDLFARINDPGYAHPDRLVHKSGTQTLTYGEWLDRSNRVAAYLARTLSDNQTLIVIRGHQAPEMLIGFLIFCEGRRDHQIKLHKYRIEPGDVEENPQARP